MDDINVRDGGKGECKPTQAIKGPQKPWEIDVDVYLKSVGPPADFQMKACLPIDKTNKNLYFYNEGRPGFIINFHLYDNTNNGAGSGYVFPNPPAPPNKESEWALWSRQGPGCPPKDHGQWAEFTSQNVKDQGQTLVVVNKNETVTEFGYTLRVTNDDGQKFVDLDPGGYNQNGNNPLVA
jgi:hypothetical protein